MSSTNNNHVELTLEERILRTAERRLHRFLREALPHIHKSDLDLIVFRHARNLAKDVMNDTRMALDDYAEKLTASRRGRRAA